MRRLLTYFALGLAALGMTSCAEEEPSEFNPEVVEDPPVEPDDAR